MPCCGPRRRPGFLVGAIETGLPSAARVAAADASAALAAADVMFEDTNWKVRLDLRVYDQCSCGSCWVMCSIGLMESAMKIAGFDEALSVQFCNDYCDPGGVSNSTFERMQKKLLLSLGSTVACLGGSPGQCLTFLKQVGVPRAEDYREYIARDRFSWEIQKDKVKFGEPERFRLKDFGTIGTDIGNPVEETDRIRFADWLSRKGPGVSTVKCTDWGSNSLDDNHVYRGRYGKKHVHCVLVVGFKWQERLWTVLNSHGRGYGDDGIFYVPFDAESGLGEVFLFGYY